VSTHLAQSRIEVFCILYASTVGLPIEARSGEEGEGVSETFSPSSVLALWVDGGRLGLFDIFAAGPFLELRTVYLSAAQTLIPLSFAPQASLSETKALIHRT